MTDIVDPAVEAYAEDHTTPPPTTWRWWRTRPARTLSSATGPA